jgi:hypothetical protein
VLAEVRPVVHAHDAARERIAAVDDADVLAGAAALAHHDTALVPAVIAHHDRTGRATVIADHRTAAAAVMMVRVCGTREQAEHRRNKKCASHAGEPSAGDMWDWWI